MAELAGSVSTQHDDNRYDYKRIEVHPIAGALGAEVRGVDIASGVDDETMDEIHRAWLERHVLFFRDQTMTPDDHIAFARRIGDIHPHLLNKGLDGYPEIVEVKKKPDQKLNNGGRWHSDQMYTPKPAKGTMLYSRELPPLGGDTMFSNQYLAYESLSEGLKKTLGGLKGVNNGDSRNHPSGMNRMERIKAGIGTISQIDPGDAPIVSSHPVVRTHPETGRKALYLGSHTERFDGWSEDESAQLLDYLKEHTHRPEFTCRFKWSLNTLTFWDNRCTQHFAINDYHGHQRRIHKIMIQGDAPF
jgi:taurine dioxygenase